MINKRVKSKIFHYDFLKKNCKGELTTQQIVGLIVLITSFVVILILIFRLDIGNSSVKDICRNSVVLKAKTSSGFLDCKTSYVCISGGGECGGFEEDYKVVVDLKGNDQDKKNNISKAIADEMVDCWWMFGEGGVNYVGLDLKGEIISSMHCALCSTIKFDNEIQELKFKEDFSYDYLYGEYLQKTRKNGNNYLAYLYGFSDASKIDFKKSKFEFDERYLILTGIGKTGVVKGTLNWVVKDADDLNSLFGLDKIFGKGPQFKELSDMPVTIKKNKEINELGCQNYVTKA